MYEDLICNDNKFGMCFKGFPFKAEYAEYMKREEFYQYLLDYVTHWKLRQLILFKTFVSGVRLTSNMTEEEKAEVK